MSEINLNRISNIPSFEVPNKEAVKEGFKSVIKDSETDQEAFETLKEALTNEYPNLEEVRIIRYRRSNGENIEFQFANNDLNQKWLRDAVKDAMTELKQDNQTSLSEILKHNEERADRWLFGSGDGKLVRKMTTEEEFDTLISNFSQYASEKGVDAAEELADTVIAKAKGIASDNGIEAEEGFYNDRAFTPEIKSQFNESIENLFNE